MTAENSNIGARLALIVLGFVLAATGVFMLVGGVQLASLGGSLYFAPAGLGLVAAGVLIALRRRLGAILYFGVFFITVMLILTLSGYELYYAGAERIRDWSHGIHVIFGVLSPVFLAWHIAAGRIRQKRLLKRPQRRGQRSPPRTKKTDRFKCMGTPSNISMKSKRLLAKVM